MQGKAISKEERKLIAQVYASGKSSRDCLSFFKISNSTLYAILDENGIERQSKSRSIAAKAGIAKRKSEESANKLTANPVSDKDFCIKLNNSLIAVQKSIDVISVQNEEIIGILDSIRKVWCDG